MDSNEPTWEVVITAPDPGWLADLSRTLIEERLCAGSHLVAEIRSVYRWEGEIVDKPEARVALDTRQSLVPEIVALVAKAHPYHVPCVVAWPVKDGNPAYLGWIVSETRNPAPIPNEEDDTKASKERMHIDIETDDVGAEVQRLEALGASRWDHQQERGNDFWVLGDPWGNEFCVLQTEFPDLSWRNADPVHRGRQSGYARSRVALGQATPVEETQWSGPATRGVLAATGRGAGRT